jgi:hypothetical protein
MALVSIGIDEQGDEHFVPEGEKELHDRSAGCSCGPDLYPYLADEDDRAPGSGATKASGLWLVHSMLMSWIRIYHCPVCSRGYWQRPELVSRAPDMIHWCTRCRRRQVRRAV